MTQLSVTSCSFIVFPWPCCMSHEESGVTGTTDFRQAVPTTPVSLCSMHQNQTKDGARCLTPFMQPDGVQQSLEPLKLKRECAWISGTVAAPDTERKRSPCDHWTQSSHPIELSDGSPPNIYRFWQFKRLSKKNTHCGSNHGFSQLCVHKCPRESMSVATCTPVLFFPQGCASHTSMTLCAINIDGLVHLSHQ